ncbi:MAG: FMN-binding protein [Actinomycetales bacterium]
MKRAILALVGTAAGLYALLGFKTEPLPTTSSISASTPSSSTPTPSSSTSPPSSSTPTPSSSTPTPSSSSSKAATTTVTGNAIDTRYGPVQVQLTMTAGRITAVRVLQYPAHDGRDIQINNYALPVLIQETTQAQSANIDMVSGATFTSDGYIQSLQSALDKTK